jgi:long-subunit fatty acid transport protein
MHPLGATLLSFAALLAGPAGPTQTASETGSAPTSIVDQDEIDLTNQTSFVLGVGARALGMGGAFLARADDATAASWNPAGLSYLRRPEVSLVGDYLSSRSNSGIDQIESEATTLDFLAVTYPLAWKGNAGAAQISYQRAIPFNASRSRFVPGPEGTETPDNLRTFEGEGGFDVLAVGLGWKATRTLRVGGTFNYWVNGYQQTFERTPRRRVLRVDTFDLEGWNVNLGLLWSPLEELNLGIVGKTPFTADVTLYRRRTDFVTDSDVPPETITFTSSDVRLEFPGAFGLGASWRPRDTLTLSADYTYTFWSDARIRNYFTLLTVPEGTEGKINVFDSLVWPNVDAESQADSIQIRFGVEYVLLGSRVKIPVRAGYVNDQQYTKDFQGNAPHFHSVTFGSGIIVGSALFDVAYQYQWGSYRVDGSAAGTAFSSKTHRVYASVIYRWGGIR